MVPILGHKGKKIINLRLREAKTNAEDFNLFQFNDRQYEYLNFTIKLKRFDVLIKVTGLMHYYSTI